MRDSRSDRFSLKKALLYITLSVFGVTGGVVGIYAYTHYVALQRARNPATHLLTLVQTGPEREALSSVYLAEYLGLSADRPTSLYAFDLSAARAKLLAHPVVEEAKVRLFNPGTVYIDYTMRQPVAYLGDQANTALDGTGMLFPIDPFYERADLPEVFLGLKTKVDWGKQLDVQELQLAFELMQFFEDHPSLQESRLVRVDVSRAGSPSYGQREIVLEIAEPTGRRFLRLGPSHYPQALQDYSLLRKQLPADDAPAVVDLRIPRMAFVPCAGS